MRACWRKASFSQSALAGPWPGPHLPLCCRLWRCWEAGCLAWKQRGLSLLGVPGGTAEREPSAQGNSDRQSLDSPTEADPEV